jgi:signal transduction histidine kinase
MQTILTSLLGGRFGAVTVRQCASAFGTGDVIQVELALVGATLTVQINRKEGWPQIVILTLPLIVAVSFLLSLVIALSIWTLWRISRPLRMLANTVDRFGENVTIAPLEVTGSIEIRQVAHAFNRMQERISRSVEERKCMLMAVGHDLRTPLTRLKLRIDMDGAQADHHALRRDLDLMQKMVDGALSYLNDQKDHEPAETVDLGALVEGVCLALADAGRDITYAGVYGWECQCQPVAITRAVCNLIENGCRYGTHVKVDVWCEDRWAIIEVRDNGPGIPAAMRDLVLLPFARLDPARAAEGRLGLGLSIVQEAIRRHGGELSLTDADPSGLLVRIALPIDAKGGPVDSAQGETALPDPVIGTA